MKIIQIKINNYRAFYGNYTIDLGEKGKNLLIYGENGSGKSSLYKALETIMADKPILERHLFATENELVSISLDVRDPVSGNKLSIDFFAPSLRTTDAWAVTLLKNANKTKGFLDYKVLLRTYLNHTDTVDLFDILLNGILFHTQNKVFDFGVGIGEKWAQLRDSMSNVRQSERIQTENKTGLGSFNDALRAILDEVERDTNAFLSKFTRNKNLQVRFVFRGVNYEKRSVYNGNSIELKVDYYDKNIKHQDFLNEARLSALAISLYLACVKNNPQDVNGLKLMFLDDIFIGLDTSNRLPLLDILNESFADYQIFMTTYDKNWYEVAKQKFESKASNNWTYLEMYIDDISHDFDVPCLLPHKSKIEKAEHHLHIHDYRACAVYLRTQCEAQLERILPTKYKNKTDKNQDPNFETKSLILNDLLNNFTKFCAEENIPFDAFENLKIYKNHILNPFAHNDIHSPIYKQELIDTIKSLKSLEKIKISEIKTNQSKHGFTFTAENKSGDSIEIALQQRDAWTFIKYSDELYKISNDTKCSLSGYKKNLDDFIKNEPENQHFDSILKLYHFVREKHDIEPTHDLLDILQTRERDTSKLPKKLKDLVEGAI